MSCKGLDGQEGCNLEGNLTPFRIKVNRRTPPKQSGESLPEVCVSLLFSKKSTEAAVFYFEHGDYQKSKELCMEALTMWSEMQNTASNYPTWLIDKNIDDCNLLLKQIKRIQSADQPKNISI